MSEFTETSQSGLATMWWFLSTCCIQDGVFYFRITISVISDDSETNNLSFTSQHFTTLFPAICLRCYFSSSLNTRWNFGRHDLVFWSTWLFNSELELIYLLYFSNCFPTSGNVYYSFKPIESAVCYCSNINFNFPWIYKCNQRLFFDQSWHS